MNNMYGYFLPSEQRPKMKDTRRAAREDEEAPVNTVQYNVEWFVSIHPLAPGTLGKILLSRAFSRQPWSRILTSCRRTVAVVAYLPSTRVARCTTAILVNAVSVGSTFIQVVLW